MSNWLAIFYKDLRMTRTFAVSTLIGTVIVAGLFLYWGSQTHTGTSLGLSTTLMFLFVFLWPSLLWVSWSREWRGTSALWLQVPKPGWSLLGSKLLAGLTYTVPTLLLVGAWLTGMLFMDLPLNSGSLHPWNLAMLSYDVQMALFVITIIFVANVYISIALVFALTVMKSVQTLVGGWRWLLGLVIGVVFVWGPEALAKWKLYHRLFDFGLFRIQFHVPNFSSATDIKLYAGEILIALVLLGLVFAACSWLFDRRIEV